MPAVVAELARYGEGFVDYDACFEANIDSDYDSHLKGVSLVKFNANHGAWISLCCSEQAKERVRVSASKAAKKTRLTGSGVNSSFVDEPRSDESPQLLLFAFALSLLCRRALVTACKGGADFASAFT